MSAGVYAKQDAEADPRSIEVAPEFGVRLNEHRAKPLTDDLIESVDAIFVMDALNESGLLRRYPASWRKVHMLGAYFGTHHSSNGEIPDPYEGGIEDVRRCYDRLQSGIHHLVMHLAGK
jgi:protein-tyrosine-phosphatase